VTNKLVPRRKPTCQISRPGTEQPIDTGTAAGKAAGVYEGRPASIDAAQVRELKAQGLGASEIAKALKIGRASVYRVLEAGSAGR
jgi:DNA invertase Pin-like site-specific DNA recombinase